VGMEGLMKTQKISSRDRLAGKPLIGFKTPVRRAPSAMVGVTAEVKPAP